MAKRKLKFDFDDDSRVRLKFEIESTHSAKGKNGATKVQNKHFHGGFAVCSIMIAFMINPEGVIQILQLVKELFDTLS